MEKLEFIHTDGRHFSHAGTTPHLTRDKRQISLNVWHTSCTVPGCTNVVPVRTATDTPNNWPRFTPRRFCDAHGLAARRKGLAKLKLARAAGIKAWRESDEGKAAIERKWLRTVGRVEQLVLDAIDAFTLVSDEIEWADVAAYVHERMPIPHPDKRDTRKYRVLRALVTLQAKHRIQYYAGKIIVNTKK